MPKPLTFTGKDGGWTPVEGEPGPYTPHPIVDDAQWRRNSTQLWVGIASFRDPLCGQTLYNMFSKALFPERLQVLVIQQNQAGDPTCLEQYCELGPCPHAGQVQIYSMKASEAKGPVHARAIQSNLVPTEPDFCMQVDAHMDFVVGWDVFLFRFWGQTRNEYAVLTTYVAGFEQLDININGLYEVPHLCHVIFTKDGNVRNEQAKAARSLVEPKLSPLWAAGLSFSRCHAEHAVHNDPKLPHVFDGEEFTRAVRLWTSGYDFYTPPRTVVVHHYHRKRLGTWPANATERRGSERRMQRLLQMSPGDAEQLSTPAAQLAEFGGYGLGDRRSLDQYIAFSGVDCRHRTYLANKCGSLQYVPFQETEERRRVRAAFVAAAAGSSARAKSLRSGAVGGSLEGAAETSPSPAVAVLWWITGMWGLVVIWCTYRILRRVNFSGGGGDGAKQRRAQKARMRRARMAGGARHGGASSAMATANQPPFESSVSQHSHASKFV
jgi:hypothetical protein